MLSMEADAHADADGAVARVAAPAPPPASTTRARGGHVCGEDAGGWDEGAASPIAASPIGTREIERVREMSTDQKGVFPTFQHLVVLDAAGGLGEAGAAGNAHAAVESGDEGQDPVKALLAARLSRDHKINQIKNLLSNLKT
jgi:hypothetical protein